ncbi:hypothetical protein FRC08_008671 [Ceratobasidium sp. 394]|nr:hypothetical protein FRC08_008671 [Ceratobasidium sp. 394]KAG9099071.1 hypothetical protein FS749_002207 [Ceratobasidium sp. UAMH 11750]
MATPSANLTAIVGAVVAHATATAVAPSATPTEAAVVQRHSQNPVVAFIIGLCIVTLASVLNAGKYFSGPFRALSSNSQQED